jgi:hypothetical protein
MLLHSAAKPLEEKMTTNTNWEIVKGLQQNAAHIDCREHFKLGENAKVEIAHMPKT